MQKLDRSCAHGPALELAESCLHAANGEVPSGEASTAEDAAQLAHRIQEEGMAARLDSALLASVARALRDKGVLDKQLKRAREVCG